MVLTDGESSYDIFASELSNAKEEEFEKFIRDLQDNGFKVKVAEFRAYKD